MRQIILTETLGSWSYVVVQDGREVAADVGYDTAADALADAEACPTPV